MKRFTAFFCIFLLASAFVFSQEDDDIDDDDDGYKSTVTFNMNQPGDQYINIALMVTFPLNFGGKFPMYRTGQMQTGGAGMLGYHRFLTSWFALGADISFGYHPTLGSNVFTYVPLVVSVTIQPSIGRFEFPVNIGVGGAMETYLSRTYFPGLIVKGSAGIYFRATPSWSFGVFDDFMYMPQWYADKDKRKYNDYGLFDSIAIGARYHF